MSPTTKAWLIYVVLIVFGQQLMLCHSGIGTLDICYWLYYFLLFMLIIVRPSLWCSSDDWKLHVGCSLQEGVSDWDQPWQPVASLVGWIRAVMGHPAKAGKECLHVLLAWWAHTLLTSRLNRSYLHVWVHISDCKASWLAFLKLFYTTSASAFCLALLGTEAKFREKHTQKQHSNHLTYILFLKFLDFDISNCTHSLNCTCPRARIFLSSKVNFTAFTFNLSLFT